MVPTVMDGVQIQKRSAKNRGCRLILPSHFKFVVLLHKETETVQNGQQSSHFRSQMMVPNGHAIRIDDGEEMVRDKNVAFNTRVTTGIA